MGRREEQRQQHHRQLLDAGTELLAEQPFDVTSQLKVAAIVERSGLSVGAFYGHWPSQGDYFRELLDHVLSASQFDQEMEATAAAVRAAAEHDVPLDALVALAANQNLVEVLAEAAFDVQMAAWPMGRRDPEVGDAIRRTYARLTEFYSAVYAEVMDAYDLEFVDPTMDTTRLAVMLTAAAEGVALRAGVDPEAVATGPEGEPFLFGDMAVLLVNGVTRPRGSATA